MDLSRVAALAEIDEDELFQLNPALKQRTTLDGPQHLLVPSSKAQLLTSTLSTMKPEELLAMRPKKQVFDEVETARVAGRSRSYKVRSGDNLTLIAKANKVDVHDLQRWNKLNGQAAQGRPDPGDAGHPQAGGQGRQQEAGAVQGQERRLAVHRRQAFQRRDATSQALEPAHWPWRSKPGQMLVVSGPR